MPKIIDHDQRRTEIIDITWQLIVEGGIEAATMRDIAKRAGFANGALKHYFPGKDDIIRGAYERALSSITEQLQPHIEGLTGLAAIRAAMIHTLPLTADDVTAARVLLSYLERCAFNPGLDQHYGSHVQNWKAGYREWLRQARQAGEVLTSVDDELLISEIIQMNVGATILSVVAAEQIDTEVLLSQVDRFVERLQQTC